MSIDDVQTRVAAEFCAAITFVWWEGRQTATVKLGDRRLAVLAAATQLGGDEGRWLVWGSGPEPDPDAHHPGFPGFAIEDVDAGREHVERAAACAIATWIARDVLDGVGPFDAGGLGGPVGAFDAGGLGGPVGAFDVGGLGGPVGASEAIAAAGRGTS